MLKRKTIKSKAGKEFDLCICFGYIEENWLQDDFFNLYGSKDSYFISLPPEKEEHEISAKGPLFAIRYHLENISKDTLKEFIFATSFFAGGELVVFDLVSKNGYKHKELASNHITGLNWPQKNYRYQPYMITGGYLKRTRSGIKLLGLKKEGDDISKLASYLLSLDGFRVGGNLSEGRHLLSEIFFFLTKKGGKLNSYEKFGRRFPGFIKEASAFSSKRIIGEVFF